MRSRVLLVGATLAVGVGLCGCASEGYPHSVRLVGQDSDSVLMLELTVTPTSDAQVQDIRGTYETVSAVGGLMKQGHGLVKAELQGRRETFTLTTGTGFEAPASPLVVSGWVDRSGSGAWKSLTLTLPVETGGVREMVLSPSTMGAYNEKVHDLAGVGEGLGVSSEGATEYG